MSINYLKVRNGITLKPTAMPGTPENGDIYYDSTSNTFEFYQNGTYITIPTGSAFATTSLNNLASTAVNASIIPASNGAISLGSTSLRWENVYLNNAIYDGNGNPAISTANKTLTDNGNVVSVDWASRVLNDSGSTPQFAWSTSGLIANAYTGYLYANAASVITASTTIPTSALSGSVSLTTQVSGVLPIANGGTDNGSLAVTAGGVIYTDGTRLQNVGVGSSGQVLQSNGSSTPTWVAASTAAAVTVSPITSNPSPAATNTIYLLSGASFSVTLPTAVGISGQMVTLQHSGTSLTQIYTILTTSGQTVGGIASGSYVLYTNGELLTVYSDGSNWQIHSHKTNTPWSADAAIKLSASSAYVFSWTGNQSIVAGDTYSDGAGNTFTVTTTTNTTTGTFSGTPGTPATTGTLTRVTGTGVTPINWTSRTVTGAPVPGTTVSNRMIWRRVGQNVEIYFELFQTVAGTAGSGNYIVYLPTGLVADVSQISLITGIVAQNAGLANFSTWGHIQGAYGATPTGNLIAEAVPYSNVSFRIAGTSGSAFAMVDGGSNFSLANAISWTGRLFVPISGWQP